jgi:hypothetical protein
VASEFKKIEQKKEYKNRAFQGEKRKESQYLSRSERVGAKLVLGAEKNG